MCISFMIKSVLEMKDNLIFATLMVLTTATLLGKCSTDLCAQLTSITQMPNEVSVDFILRYIELREKLILTSKTSGEMKLEYDEVLVSRLFLKSVERGSESNLILHEIRPVLRSQGVPVELLKEPQLMGGQGIS